MKGLYQALQEYSVSEYYPMHMPGHKRNTMWMPKGNPTSIDITEIDGFDDLHEPKGIIADCMQKASFLYQSDHTELLINGSSAGILAGICASVKKGDRILVARNCHKSVYHAISLCRAEPIYLYPNIDSTTGICKGITKTQIERMCQQFKGIKLVVLTSPTYEGILSEVEEIVSYLHRQGIICLVDEAHGAHLGFHHAFPRSAVQKGADIVIHSLHKTLPSYTQTGLLHIKKGLVKIEDIKYYLRIFQTSSPSYVLMGGIDHCLNLLMREKDALFEAFYLKLKRFYASLTEISQLQLQHSSATEQVDQSKIVILTQNRHMNGVTLYQSLREEYKLQMELKTDRYVLGMTSIADTEEGFLRFTQAIQEIDARLLESADAKAAYEENIMLESKPQPAVLGIEEAYFHTKEKIELSASVGRICGEYIYLYPPGIPIIVPGERVSKEAVDQIDRWLHSGLSVRGLANQKEIKVLK